MVLPLYLALISEARAACAVTLLSPVAGSTSTSPPTFRWAASGDCRTFTVQLSPTTRFIGSVTSLSAVGAASRATTMSQGSYDSLTASGTSTYYWRVRSRDSVGAMLASTSRRITLTDQDVDGDGSVAVAYGGTDCDDGDAAAYPGADDYCDDGVDQDCDGRDSVEVSFSWSGSVVGQEYMYHDLQYYAVDLSGVSENQAMDITLSVGSGTADVEWYLFSPEETVLTSDCCWTNIAPYAYVYSIWPEASGSYYLQIHPLGTYTFALGGGSLVPGGTNTFDLEFSTTCP